MTGLSLLFILSCVGVCGSVVALCLQYKHLLSMLLSLEAMMLSIFVLFYSVSSTSGSLNSYLCLGFLGLSACEASLGLAVLVSLIRTHGNDYVRSFSSHKC
uniref:NADH-ubiquinone oxidoreductase chain 4L n=1 Tax=Granata lyrata TaxID=479586 RepID=A0A0S1F5M1_GRALY|nr:NADH dehydrogenase subunit 4L [Granata lyrata]ALK03369.1 NADH dehydrogenase subunit 4L [Granata lyrata]